MKSNRKVSKPSRHAKPESISIQLKRPIVKPVAPSDTPSNTTLLAKQLRQRLAAAAAKLTAKDDFTDPADIDIVAEPTLSTSDWPPKTPALRNLNLLKQYLIFVSQENHTNVELNSEDHSIHFDFSNCNSEYVKTESVAHSGATLIESLVHGTNAMTNQLHLSKHEESRRLSRSSIDRRKPGRPPKAKMEDDKLEHEARIRIKRPSRSMPYPMMKKKKKHTVQCICSSAHEEFGTMVQCDECLHWLHSDCLELTDQALKQSFRCPACFVASESGKPVASLSWRYLAQWKSQRLADTQSDMTSDEEDETEYHHGPTKLRLQTKSHLRYSTIEEEYNDDDDDDDENDSTDAVESYGPLTPVDLAELSPLDGHHSEDSTSEASTPDGKLYLADPFETPDNVGDMALDSESLEILSRLAYLQSLESVRKELFAPNASDVFLCENIAGNETLLPGGPSQTPRFAPDVPPSTMCPQDLSEFSFDSGPFWEPLQ